MLVPSPHQEAVESAVKLYNDIKQPYPIIVEVFESRWTAWRQVTNQAQAASSSLRVSAETVEFEALKRLGPKILPLVVYKLATDANNFEGVFLYNAIEKDPAFRQNVEQPRSRYSLQLEAAQIVELNCKRNKLFNERMGTYTQYCVEISRSSSTADRTCTDEYYNLIELGPSIIANVLVRYSKEGGAWYEMVHELIHGHQMEARIMSRGLIYEIWRDYFNSDDDYDRAYLYDAKDWDSYFYTGDYTPAIREHLARRALRDGSDGTLNTGPDNGGASQCDG